MVVVLVGVALLALGVLVTGNWYLWRRLFRDTTRGPGLARRAGAVVIAGGWALAIGAIAGERAGAPFWLQRILAWPGFLWLALSVYLLLGVVAGEAVRPLLRRFLEKRARAADPSGTSVGDPVPDPVPVGAPASERSAPETKPGPGAPGPGSPAAGAPTPSRRVFVSRVVAGAAAAAGPGHGRARAPGWVLYG